MAWWVPLAMAAGGYVLDKQTGGDGTKGAIGGLTMGYGMGAGGAAGASGGAAGGKGMAGNTAANSAFAGNALGQGGMATAQGMNALGMGSAVNAGLGIGQFGNVVTPENTPNILMDSAYNAPVAPTDIYTGDLSMMANQNLGGSTPIGLDNPDLFTNGGYDPTLSAEQLNYQPNWTPDRNVVSGTGGYEQSGMFSGGLLDYLGDFVPEKKDLGGLALSMGLNALTPEQQERIRHQQAMVSRGQTGSLLGQGGYQGIGGQYISRAQ